MSDHYRLRNQVIFFTSVSRVILLKHIDFEERKLRAFTSAILLLLNRPSDLFLAAILSPGF